jgi:class 3 adenylate cyclase
MARAYLDVRRLAFCPAAPCDLVVPRVVLGWLLLLPGLGFYAVAVGLFTFLFTDIEGSSALLQRVGEDVYAHVLADHHGLIRLALAGHGDREVDTAGDGFFALRPMRACARGQGCR